MPCFLENCLSSIFTPYKFPFSRSHLYNNCHLYLSVFLSVRLFVHHKEIVSVHLFVCPSVRPPMKKSILKYPTGCVCSSIFSPPSQHPISNLSVYFESLGHCRTNKTICSQKQSININILLTEEFSTDGKISFRYPCPSDTPLPEGRAKAPEGGRFASSC